MAYTEYPKALYGAKGWNDLDDMVTVRDADEEKAARANGYTPLGALDEVRAPAEAPQADAPPPKPRKGAGK